MKLEFSRKLFEKYSNFINICPVGAELFRADGQTDRQTDMTKLIVVFRNFSNAPKNNQISNFMQIHPVGAECYIRTDGHTDTKKVNSRLLQNCKRRLRNWLSQTKPHCIRNDQQYALIFNIPIFYVMAHSCFGSSLPSSGSFFDPSVLL
jgi:hypothetical protein